MNTNLRMAPVALLLVPAVACTATGRHSAAQGAVAGGIAGAVGGALVAAVFGGNVGRAAGRGAVWGAGTGAVSGAIRGDMAEDAMRRQQEAAHQQREAAEIAALRSEIGDDNLAGLEALATCRYEVALAYAKTARRSTDPEFRIASKWLEALVFADQGERQRVEALYPTLVDADSEIDSAEEADAALWDLRQELRSIRVRYGLPARCET